ncbi:MAG: bile acid:sodium symporter family protein [Planctomycetia bacterium]|nr:bile acid:sodium symporter family protein [Planctomycetia bacterium]
MFRQILSRYLLLWLVLACLLAYFWPRLCGSGAVFDPFLLSRGMMQGLIALTMLAIGSLLPWEEIRQVAKNWPKVLGGTAVQYLSMPLLAYAVSCCFGLEGGYFYGMILVGAVPGAMASNMLTLIARGNVSYSVGLTTSATLLSPLVVPWVLVFFLGKFMALDVGEMSQTLLLTVVMPVLIGFVLSQCFPFWKRLAQAAGEILANLVIIWIIASVVAQNRATLEHFPLFLVLPLLCVNLGGYTAGWLGGKCLRIDTRMSRALIIEVGMQNAGLGTFLARQYFPDFPEAALCCAMYTFGCMFTGILLVQYLSASHPSPHQP